MRRLMIIACGATKRHDAEPLAAIERYMGPPYRTLRKALRDLGEDRPDILVVSAEFGLIAGDTPIPDYDRRMNRDRAAELRPQVAQALAAALATGSYESTLINLGADYLPALAFTDDARTRLGEITEAHGGIGERMSQMKAWLLASSATPVLL
jgi:hypothetical protein